MIDRPSYTVEFSARAAKSLEKLPAKIFERVSKVADGLEINPRPHDCKKLEGEKDDVATAEALIPVEKIAGPLLLISGTEDGVWPSTKMANKIMRRMEQFDRNKNSRQLCFRGAGHNLSVPYLPSVAFDDATNSCI